MNRGVGIVLVGFMGAGKSTVGRLLAARLGVGFVDLDERIEALAGQPIPGIFESRGEPGFRELEREAVRRLDGSRPQVIATGGGVLEDPDNLERLARLGTLVWLFAGPAEGLARAGRDGTVRPLLAGDPDQARARAMARWELRRWQYARAAVWVDARGVGPDGVADRVEAALAWADGDPPAGWVLGGDGSAFPILCGPGVMAHVPRWLERSGVRGPCWVVADRTVQRLGVAGPLEQALEKAGRLVGVAGLGPGEGAKRLSAVGRLYTEALRTGLDRGGVVVAAGGGACLDAAGFFASTYMRGVPWSAVPTTLLAQVDAAVGGKTAVNHPLAKNLIGTFHPPRFVACDTRALGSLPDRELRSGMAEVVKHGLVGDPRLFEELVERLGEGGRLPAARIREAIDPTLVGWAARVKAVIVSEDLHERGLRAVLNLGHTTAHALEALGGFRRLRHGEAVAVGLVTALVVSRQLGVLKRPELVDEVVALLRRLGLPVASPLEVDADRVWEAMAYDKKNREGQRRWVLLEAPGRPAVVRGEVTLPAFREAWSLQQRLYGPTERRRGRGEEGAGHSRAQPGSLGQPGAGPVRDRDVGRA